LEEFLKRLNPKTEDENEDEDDWGAKIRAAAQRRPYHLEEFLKRLNPKTEDENGNENDWGAQIGAAGENEVGTPRSGKEITNFAKRGDGLHRSLGHGRQRRWPELFGAWTGRSWRRLACGKEQSMNTPLGFERCLTFINCHMRSGKAPASDEEGAARPVITLSRQMGSGAHTIGEGLARYMQERGDGGPWAVFDRNLVEKVLEDHRLPKRLAAFMPEDRIRGVEDTLDELFGLHPPSSELVRQTAETILHLAEMGNVIVIGRGANLITGKLEQAFHVRLVGSLERRRERVQEAEHVSAKEALRQIKKADAGRKRYLRRYFRKDIDDGLLYHLTINTDLVPCEQAVVLIGDAVLNRSSKPRYAFA
jgi:cytidylate kinase